MNGESTGTRLVAAIDVGGTAIKAALVAEDLRVVHTLRTPTRRIGQEVDVGQITELTDRLRALADGVPLCGAGVVVPGIVDERLGIARAAVNLGWRDVALRERLGADTGLPVALGHDVRAGGLAEFTVGAAAGAHNAMFVPIGTGIAAAVLVDRHQLVADGYAGELGHVVVDPHGTVCGCGVRGCLETIATAPSIRRRYAALRGEPAPSAARIADAVRAGEQHAVRVWDDAVAALATALTMAITLLGPEVIVVGGGLAESGDTLLAPLRDALAGRTTFQRVPTLVPATLGDNAGCLGAALLAWRAVP